jgi:tRNA dimethylallyltransferase
MNRADPPRTFYLLGPTAAGKSELAVRIAERAGAEIVNADAFQVYAQMPILTAWPDEAFRARAPHHLLGIIPPAEHCDVARFRTAALGAIAEIHQRGKAALVVGGSGLYVRALTRGLALLPPADAALRAQLERHSLAQLQDKLRQLDPTTAQSIDLQNPRRIVRALEVRLLTGRSFAEFRDQWCTPLPAGITGLILLRARAELFARINRRTSAMFDAGVIDEVRALGKIGPTASQAIGYRQIRALLQGACTRDECLRDIQQATRRYAKRQITWLRREPHFASVELTNPADEASAVARCAREIIGS